MLFRRVTWANWSWCSSARRLISRFFQGAAHPPGHQQQDIDIHVGKFAFPRHRIRKDETGGHPSLPGHGGREQGPPGSLVIGSLDIGQRHDTLPLPQSGQGPCMEGPGRSSRLLPVGPERFKGRVRRVRIHRGKAAVGQTKITAAFADQLLELRFQGVPGGREDSVEPAQGGFASPQGFIGFRKGGGAPGYPALQGVPVGLQQDFRCDAADPPPGEAWTPTA